MVGTVSRLPRQRLIVCVPRMAGGALNVFTDEPAHDLGRCGVFRRAQTLEDRFLAWVDQNGETSRTIFDCHWSIL